MLSLSDLILFGFGQTIIIIIILFQKKFRQPQNLFLFFVFVVLLILFFYYYLQFGKKITHYWHGIIRPILFLPPVLGYFYAQAVISGKFVSRKIYISHFLSSIVFSILFIPILVYNTSSGSLQFNIDRYNNYYLLISSELIVLSFLLYPVLLIRLLRRFCTIEGKHYIIQLLQIKEDKFRFIMLLVVLSLVQSLIFFLDINGEYLFGISNRSTEWVIIVYLILISYIFTFLLILNPKIIHVAGLRFWSASKTSPSQSYTPSSLDLDLIKTVNSFMEIEKPYLDCNLNLSDLSEKIGVPGYIISDIINSVLKQNFFDYINNYRIEEFKSLVQDPDNKHYKLLSLAFDAGFNSKSTFNKAFKKFTGQTPSEYRSGLPAY